MPAFAIVTLGCKVNQYDSEGISNALIQHGWHRAADEQAPDLCIINTCTVTGSAAMQARQAVRQAIRRYPNARILVTGCYAQTDPDAVAAIEGVDMVVGNTNKHRIVDQLCNIIDSESSGSNESTRTFHHMPVDAFAARSRPFLKIQDGCDARCTYCIVPKARGASRSMPTDIVLEGLFRFKDAGYEEVVLTGIHLGSYGHDLRPSMTLADLLGRIIEEAPIRRIRLSSIEPNEITKPLLDLVASSEMICPHFHIPLQSGDDGILKSMNRPYTAAQFVDRIEAVAQRLPDAAIGSDVLFGFPGETDADAARTISLIEAVPITYLHVFPYSPRPGTPAASYPNQVPGDVARQRCRRMRQMGDIKRDSFVASQNGRIRPVLVESRRHDPSGWLVGITDNYIRVHLEGPDEWMGRIVSVELTAGAPGQPCIGLAVPTSVDG